MDERLLLAAKSGDAETVRKLFRKQPCLIDVNKKDNLGMTALSYACKGGHVEMTRLLIEGQADVNIADPSQTTPLHIAASGDHVDIVKLLVRGDAYLGVCNKDGLRPIDLTHFSSETWKVLHNSMRGKLPVVEDRRDVAFVPSFAITQPPKPDDGKKGKKKGKKGGKKGKKKGKKKKKR